MRFALIFPAILAISSEFTTSLGDANPYLVATIATDSTGNTFVAALGIVAIWVAP